MMRSLLIVLAALALWALPATAQQQGGPLRLEITEGVIEPMPFAVPDLVAEGTRARELAARISRVIAADLSGTGLFREVPTEAHIGRITSFDSPVPSATRSGTANGIGSITPSVISSRSGPPCCWAVAGRAQSARAARTIRRERII